MRSGISGGRFSMAYVQNVQPQAQHARTKPVEILAEVVRCLLRVWACAQHHSCLN